MTPEDTRARLHALQQEIARRVEVIVAAEVPAEDAEAWDRITKPD